MADSKEKAREKKYEENKYNVGFDDLEKEAIKKFNQEADSALKCFCDDK